MRNELRLLHAIEFFLKVAMQIIDFHKILENKSGGHLHLRTRAPLVGLFVDVAQMWLSTHAAFFICGNSSIKIR